MNLRRQNENRKIEYWLIASFQNQQIPFFCVVNFYFFYFFFFLKALNSRVCYVRLFCWRGHLSFYLHIISYQMRNVIKKIRFFSDMHKYFVEYVSSCVKAAILKIQYYRRKFTEQSWILKESLEFISIAFFTLYIHHLPKNPLKSSNMKK